MPNPYTRKRQLALQCVMIGILAATLGLAAAVKSARTYAPPTRLGPLVPLGLFEVATPENWNVSRTWRKGEPPSPMLQATDKERGQVLRATQFFVDYDVTPEGILDTFYGRKTEDGATGATQIADQPALTLTVALERRGDGGISLTVHQFAVVVIDRRVALAIELESPGEATSAADRQLFRDVVSGIKRRTIAPLGP